MLVKQIMWAVGVFCTVIASADSSVCQKFIEHVNALQTLQAAFTQPEGTQQVRGVLRWKRPFFIRADMDETQMPLTIIVNAEGSFVVNNAFNTVTQADTSNHPLRQLLEHPLQLSDVALISTECGYTQLRVLACSGLIALCDEQGQLVGWIVQGSRRTQKVFLQDVIYNGGLSDAIFATPRAPTALERKEFWSRHKNIQAFSA